MKKESNCSYLLGNLEYPSDLMAIKEAHVFKYADRVNLYFNCQINIVVKEPNGECVRERCAEPSGFATNGNRAQSAPARRPAARRRGKRDVHQGKLL